MKNVINSIRFTAVLAFVAIIAQSFTTPSVSLPSGTVLLPQGTPVLMRLNQNINSAHMEIGNVVYFEVANPVIVDGKEVIAQGTIAEGEVTSLDRLDGCTDCAGNYQSIEIMVDKVKAVDGQFVRLYGKPMVTKGKCAGCPVELKQGMRLTSTVQNNMRIKI
jgi:hypothetical protein